VVPRSWRAAGPISLAGDKVLDWHAHEHAITSRSGKLTISSTLQTAVFDAALPASKGASINRSVDRLIGHLARTRAHTGLGEEWLALTADRHLTNAVASLLEGKFDDPVLYWLGRGPGLTPSGDDVLVGMIAALWSAGAIDSSIMTPVRQLLEDSARPLTTDISVEYLHYACQGLVIGGLRDLLVTLDRSDMSGTAAAVNRLHRFGHTSGMDCLLGAVTALRHLGRAHRHVPHHAGTSRPAAAPAAEGVLRGRCQSLRPGPGLSNYLTTREALRVLTDRTLALI
jgi:Protein of unknown function (DUF2877)